MNSQAMSIQAAPALRGLSIAAVVIGRNEGERLLTCLRSLQPHCTRLVYVDSGSTDGSIDAAHAIGADVVELDMSQPFTAARARNAGLRRACEAEPQLEFVHFVDGDCEVVPGWMNTAVAYMRHHHRVAAVCGRRRERYPQRSIYNQLCDIEWDTPTGEARACGGDALMRVAAVNGVGGYRDDLIAGEEPELCVRLRAQGWRIWRLDADMTLHDAAMLRFSQWWTRTTRAGYAFAQGAYLHGALPEQHWVRESRSAWAWGLMLPLVTAAAIAFAGPKAAWLLLIYPAQAMRLACKASGPMHIRALRGAFLVLGKFAEASGQLRFWVHRLAGRTGQLIEYK